MPDLGATDTPAIPPKTESQLYRSYNGGFDSVSLSRVVRFKYFNNGFN